MKSFRPRCSCCCGWNFRYRFVNTPDYSVDHCHGTRMQLMSENNSPLSDKSSAELTPRVRKMLKYVPRNADAPGRNVYNRINARTF